MGVLYDGSTTEGHSRTSGNPSATFFGMGGFFKFSSYATYNICLAMGANAGSSYYSIFSNEIFGDEITIFNSVDATNAGFLIALNRWCHLAISVEGTGANQFKGYINGDTVITANGSTTPTNAKLWIGNNADNDGCAGMSAENVMVFNRPLSQAEWSAQARSCYPVVGSQSLHAWWKMQHANDVWDYSGNHRHLTSAGTLATDVGGLNLTSQPRRRRAWSPQVEVAGGTILPQMMQHYYGGFT